MAFEPDIFVQRRNVSFLSSSCAFATSSDKRKARKVAPSALKSLAGIKDNAARSRKPNAPLQDATTLNKHGTVPRGKTDRLARDEALNS